MIKTYLKTFIEWEQKDWAKLYLFTQLAIKNREILSIGISPFFLQYNYNIDVLQLNFSFLIIMRILKSNRTSANNILEKLKRAFKLAQVKMAESQQEQEKQTNHYKKETFKLMKKDKI